jgi:hypothetical protein
VSRLRGVSRGSTWIVGVALIGWLPLMAAPSSTACRPPVLSVSGAPTGGGLYMEYRGQVMKLQGTGWVQCGEAPTGCLPQQGPSPIQGIRLEVAPVREDALSPPESWEPSSKAHAIGTFNADETGAFSATFNAPTKSGNYVLLASVSGQSDLVAMVPLTVL